MAKSQSLRASYADALWALGGRLRDEPKERTKSLRDLLSPELHGPVYVKTKYLKLSKFKQLFHKPALDMKHA